MAGQIQVGRELFAPLSEAIADTTINNIKAAILIAVFMRSPFGKLFITLGRGSEFLIQARHANSEPSSPASTSRSMWT
jgi:hypothetical protein